MLCPANRSVPDSIVNLILMTDRLDGIYQNAFCFELCAVSFVMLPVELRHCVNHEASMIPLVVLQNVWYGSVM
jgi:hypothetical protein